MAFEQQELYDELKNQFVRDVRANKETALKGQSGSAMMMQLRKAANHHLLHRRRYDDARLHQMAELMLLVSCHLHCLPYSVVIFWAFHLLLLC